MLRARSTSSVSPSHGALAGAVPRARSGGAADWLGRTSRRRLVGDDAGITDWEARGWSARGWSARGWSGQDWSARGWSGRGWSGTAGRPARGDPTAALASTLGDGRAPGRAPAWQVRRTTDSLAYGGQTAGSAEPSRDVSRLRTRRGGARSGRPARPRRATSARLAVRRADRGGGRRAPARARGGRGRVVDTGSTCRGGCSSPPSRSRSCSASTCRSAARPTRSRSATCRSSRPASSCRRPELVGAQLLGAGVVLVGQQRQAPVKAAFNLGAEVARGPGRRARVPRHRRNGRSARARRAAGRAGRRAASRTSWR